MVGSIPVEGEDDHENVLGIMLKNPSLPAVAMANVIVKMIRSC